MFAFLQNRIQSLGHAVRGFRDILRSEHNARIHAGFTVMILAVSAWLKIDVLPFVLIVLVIVLVWIMESLNTVLEIVIDVVSPEYTEMAKRAKDIAAAAVLVAAIGAAVTGIIILGPPLLGKLNFY